jgi:nucleotide-binding universal stress UspA family protein
MKKILVPTDFSDHAQGALLYAIEMARHIDGHITLMTAYQVVKMTGVLVSMEDIIRKDNEERMADMIKKIQSQTGWAHLEGKVVMGSAATAIADHADAGHYHLIIMGTQGASGMEEVFLGSVTAAVIQRTDTPVLAIPEGYEYRPLKKIVFAVGDMELASPEVIKPLKSLVKAYNASIELVHFREMGEEPKDLSETIDLLSDVAYSVTFGFREDGVSRELNEFAEEKKADMVCMVRRKRGFFQKLFGGSITRKQAFQTRIPLLVLYNE